MSVFLARSAHIVKHEKLWQCFLIQEVLALGNMQMSQTHTHTINMNLKYSTCKTIFDIPYKKIKNKSHTD